MQIFITPGANTWTKPANAKQVFVYLIGGGGGGGSGMRGATLTQRNGGSGGGGGAWSFASWPAALLGATETVTVGSGGTGGAARATDNSAGNNGTAGGNTIFGNWLVAGGGGGGREEDQPALRAEVCILQELTDRRGGMMETAVGQQIAEVRLRRRAEEGVEDRLMQATTLKPPRQAARVPTTEEAR